MIHFSKHNVSLTLEVGTRIFSIHEHEISSPAFVVNGHILHNPFLIRLISGIWQTDYYAHTIGVGFPWKHRGLIFQLCLRSLHWREMSWREPNAVFLSGTSQRSPFLRVDGAAWRVRMSRKNCGNTIRIMDPERFRDLGPTIPTSSRMHFRVFARSLQNYSQNERASSEGWMRRAHFQGRTEDGRSFSPSK